MSQSRGIPQRVAERASWADVFFWVEVGVQQLQSQVIIRAIIVLVSILGAQYRGRLFRKLVPNSNPLEI